MAQSVKRPTLRLVSGHDLGVRADTRRLLGILSLLKEINELKKKVYCDSYNAARTSACCPRLTADSPQVSPPGRGRTVDVLVRKTDCEINSLIHKN